MSQSDTILLVDDSPSILKALQRTLRAEGYRTYTANSADEALQVMDGVNIDLIVTDENMPGTSGTKLLQVVRDKFPEVIRFMLTGATDIEVAKNAINKGEIRRFFTKPWDDFELQIAVRQALDQKELERENQRLRGVVQEQEDMLKDLERRYPGISEKNVEADGTIIID